MSKDNAGGGFLSKMAQIVKRPSGGWNELDAQQGHRDSQYNKQILAEMIERKRRNDFVRKREFDMLRKLRNRVNDAEQMQGGRPSFFQSSYSSKPDDNRVGTLNKIKAIEEEMLPQQASSLARMRQADAASGKSAAQLQPNPSGQMARPHPIKSQSGVSTAFSPKTMPSPTSIHTTNPMERTQQLPRPDRAAAGVPVTSIHRQLQPSQSGTHASSVVPPTARTPSLKPITQTQSSVTKTTPTVSAAPTPSAIPKLLAVQAASKSTSSSPVVGSANILKSANNAGSSSDASDGTSSLFSASKFYAVDVQELALDPDIEEASIRFASGDDAAAEQGLLEILKRDGSGTIDEWLTLFDLYRAIGKADAFENLAIDFANRFSTSAPQWFSMKAELASRTTVVAASTASLGKATWTADQVVEPYQVTVLTKLLERTPQPWVLDWSALERIDPDSLLSLVQLFKSWATTNVDLRFVSAAALRDCLQRTTISGNADIDRGWWDLRLFALRIMDMGDDFEMTALDYCVTYEVSPPSWEPPVCRYRSLHAGEAIDNGEGGDVTSSSAPDKPPMFVESQLHDSLLPVDSESSEFPSSQLALDWPAAELSGEILGDADHVLKAIDKRLGTTSPVVIVSCKYLIRVDFSSSGSILNWASAHQREGRQVRFTDVHRLVAAFFHVVGVTESAKVLTRTN